MGSSNADLLSAFPTPTPAQAAAAPGAPETSLACPQASAGAGAALTAVPHRMAAVPLYCSPLVHRTISGKVCKDVVQCSLAALQLPLVSVSSSSENHLVVCPRALHAERLRYPSTSKILHIE